MLSGADKSDVGGGKSNSGMRQGFGENAPFTSATKERGGTKMQASGASYVQK